MGIGPGNRCSTRYYPAEVVTSAPNPRKDRWRLLEGCLLQNSYVLKVKYLDCTNFEGVKIMVFTGKYTDKDEMDPHFADDDPSLIARFRPDAQGWALALELARKLSEVRHV